MILLFNLTIYLVYIMNYEREHLAKLAMKYVERATVVLDDFNTNPNEANFNRLALECMQAINYFEAFAVIVLKKEFGFEPVDYIQLVDSIKKQKILSEDESEKLKRIIHLRNKFAHKNYDITDENLREMVKNLKIIEKVVSYLK